MRSSETTPGLVSVISVNYNGYELSCAMIDSLKAHVSQPLEIIIVDNGSAKDEAALIKERYPDAITIRQDNLGFAGGNNAGIRASHGEFLFFLNNDTEIEADCITPLLDCFRKHPEAGMVCPKIRFFHEPRNIQFAGYTPLSGITLRNSLKGFGMPDDGSWDTASETPYAHGAAMMARRSALEDAGLMPECYFLYYEELDWSLSFTRKGWSIRYEPAAVVFHKESATTGRESAARTYYLCRNRLLFARRNLNGAEKYLSIAYQICIAAPKAALSGLLKGRSDLAKAVFKGIADFIKMKP